MQQFAIGTNITGGRNCEISYRDALLVLRARGDEVWSFNTYAYILVVPPVSHFCDLRVYERRSFTLSDLTLVKKAGASHSCPVSSLKSP